MPQGNHLTEVRTTGVPGVARRNQWRDALVDLPPDWRPHRTVAVIIPAFDAADTLDLTLASLSRQDYPEHLVEVVVVDDGSPSPYVLPEVRHTNTRVIRPETGWGRANACHAGVLASSGEIIVWLDSDIVVPADHLTAQLRWHDRLRDVATKGDIRFVDSWDITPADVAELSGTSALASRLEQNGTRHQWVEATYEKTDDLNTDSPHIFSIYTGASGSVSRDLYLAAGGMDTSLRLGEDSELAYRLAARGAVFVPARDAIAWHLGATHAQQRISDVLHHDKPYLAQRAPLIRKKRTTGGRIWAVPMVHAVVVADANDAVSARSCVDRLLTSTYSDLHISLVAPWQSLGQDRYRPLDAPDRELRLLQEWFVAEPRVSLVSEAPDDVFPAAFRLDVPVNAGLAPHVLAELVKLADKQNAGLVRMPTMDAPVTLVRTAALNRALRHLPDDDLQSQIDRVWGIWWTPAAEDAVLDLRLVDPDTPMPSSADREEELTTSVLKLQQGMSMPSREAKAATAALTTPPRGFRQSTNSLRLGLRGMLAEARRRLLRA